MKTKSFIQSLSDALFAPFRQKGESGASYCYDPEREKPIIRASICTGEQAAGFKDKVTGEFHEVMLIRDERDRETFMRAYGLERVDKEY